jgi:hypothetical protein
MVLEIGEVTGIDVPWSQWYLRHQEIRKDTVFGLFIEFRGNPAIGFNPKQLHHAEDAFFV